METPHPMRPTPPPARRPAALVVVLGLVTACEAPPGGASATCVDPAVVVVHSDYRSTAVSLARGDGSPCAPDLLTSGSADPGLLNALSGDVVTTRGPRPDGLVGLLDRYPAGVLTLFDPATGRVTHQTPLSPGFAGNPQDLLPLAPGLDLVTRLQAAPRGTPAGADLALVTHGPVDPERAGTGAVIARLTLDPLADPGLSPMPTRLARVGDVLFVGLAHLAPDFAAAGPGRVARIPLPPLPKAPASEAAQAAWLATLSPEAVALPARENCAAVEASPDGLGVWVVCTGAFRGDVAAGVTADQAERSGLAFVSPEGEVVFETSAAALTAPLGAAAPLGFTLAALDASRAVVVALGDFASTRPDRALSVIRRPDGAVDVAVLAETEAFAFGAALVDPEGGAVLLADGDPRRPRLLRLHGLDDPSRGPVWAEEMTSRTGLPPRHLGLR